MFRIQTVISRKTDMLEKCIKFSIGLFLSSPCWYNFNRNYLLEAK